MFILQTIPPSPPQAPSATQHQEMVAVRVQRGSGAAGEAVHLAIDQGAPGQLSPLPGRVQEDAAKPQRHGTEARPAEVRR